MPRKIEKIRHDLVLLGKGAGKHLGKTVALYLSDNDTPFLLSYGTSPNTAGYYKVSAEDLLQGQWDEHLNECEAEWVKAIALRLSEGETFKWQEIQQLAHEL